ncbi:MAG: carboxypeptidase regulatory-like domain-containing protein [Gemmatimonadales bacterium]
MLGVVRDSASGQPVAGAVVTLLDSAGRLASRTLTGGTGRFAAPIVGRVRKLTVIRIGYRPAAIALRLAPAHADTTVAIALGALPTLLAGVEIIDQPGCRRRDDRAAALSLWEQARSALLASIVARAADPAALTEIHYDRLLSRDGTRIVSQYVRHDSTNSNRPFIAARPVELLDRDGYVERNGGTYIYYAPDADALLDPAFVAAHCFSLQRDAQLHQREVGLSFEPMHASADVADIAGTMWVDTAARELRTLTFRYRHLDAAAEAANAGGVVSFRTPKGFAVIDRWNLHLPAIARVEPRDKNGARTTGIPESRVDVIHDIGALVTTAAWPDGTSWRVPLGTIRGTVISSAEGRPARNALVWLPGSDYAARTDSSGTFALNRLFPGPYLVFAADSAVAAMGIPENAPLHMDVDTAAATEIAIRLPSVHDYVAQTCDSLGVEGLRHPGQGEIFVVGQILLADGAPAEHAAFDARWFPRADIDQWHQAGTADSLGTFRLCYATPRVPIVIKTQFDALHLTQVDTVSVREAPIVSLSIQFRDKGRAP